MKKLLAALLAVGLFSAVPAFAGHEDMMVEHEGVRQCALQAETIQQKIHRIESEIKEGSKKYSSDDLKKLEEKLKEANELLENLGKR